MVAIACNWLPHALTDVANAIYDYMDGKEPMLPGPDFPTGGVIINKNDIPNIMRTGHGSVKVRGKYKIEKNSIVFYEVPYGVTIENLLTEIGNVCEKKEVEGVKSIRNESNKKGLRIVIECYKDFSPETIVNKLFLKTNLQTAISYNQIALVDKTPTELNLKDCIEIYIKHNVDCICKEANFDLKKSSDRLEIVDGLLKALEDIDNIINLIKKSKSAAAAKDNLIAKYNFSENQAKAIVDMKLGRIAGLEKIELQTEGADLRNKIEELKTLLTSEELQISELRNRLEALVKKFGDKRKTELMQISVKPEEKEIETVTPEDCVVIMTQNGEIKRVPTKSFKVQKRNGKGVKSLDDAILSVISTNTIDTLMLFSNIGKMYKVLVDNIPKKTNAAKGVNVNTLIALDKNEHIIAMTSLYRKSNAEYVVFVTKKGLVKKTKLEEYTKIKRNKGIISIKLKDGDSISKVTFLNEEQLVLISKNGMAIRFETKDINPIGRAASGVKSIKLEDDDEVMFVLPVHNGDDYVGIFTNKGHGKKVPLSEFPLQGRVGKGVTICREGLVGAEMICNKDNIVLIGTPNTICISAADVPKLTRASNGNIMIKNSTIRSVVKV